MAFNFGGGTAAPATGGFSLGGGAATTTAAAPATGFSFGAPAAASTAPPPAFGAPAATSAAPGGGFGFGSAAPTAAVAPTTGLGGVSAVSSAGGGGFGGFGAFSATTTSTAAAAPAFGLGGQTAPASTATTGLTLNFGSTATAAPAAAATGFGGFGAKTTAATGGLGGFGTTATASTAPAAGFAGFGATTATAAAPTATVASTTGLGGNTVAPSFGLGGLAPAVSQASTDTKTENKNVKDVMIPAELNVTVEDIKKHIKDEKTVCSDVSHISDKCYKKIQEETEALSQLVSLLATGIHKNRMSLEKLKLSSAQELVNVEIALRTKETPPSMQYENVAPMEYFVRLVSQFETEMTEYRKQINQTQQHLQLMGTSEGVTSTDIVQAVQRLHAVFTELAGKYHVIHNTLAKCKEQYILMHRRTHGGGVPAFQKTTGLPLKVASASLPKLSGPSPFSAPSDPIVQARAVLPNKPQQTMQGGMGPPTLGLNTSATPAGAFGSFAGNQSFGGGNTSFGGGNTTFGGGNTTFGGGNTTFGGGNTTFGAGNTSFGGGNTSFGGNTSAFGANTSTFGAKPTGFGAANTTGFGATTTGFGAAPTGIGGNTSTFGSPGGFGSPGASSTFISPNNGNKRNKV